MVLLVGDDSLEHGDHLGFFQHVPLDGLQELIPGHLQLDHTQFKKYIYLARSQQNFSIKHSYTHACANEPTLLPRCNSSSSA